MNEATYWRQRYEMLMATFTETVKAAIETHNAPRYLADGESYNLGKLHGGQEERDACIMDIQMHIPRSGRNTVEYKMAMRMIERIRARGEA